MFFSSALIEALRADHEKLRAVCKELVDLDLGLAVRHGAFERLVPLFESHAGREEAVVYAFMKARPELRQMALEGKEEHRLVQQILGDLRTDKNSETWSAKAKIAANLILYHLHEEEAGAFPVLKKQISREVDEQLSADYTFHVNATHHQLESSVLHLH